MQEVEGSELHFQESTLCPHPLSQQVLDGQPAGLIRGLHRCSFTLMPLAVATRLQVADRSEAGGKQDWVAGPEVMRRRDGGCHSCGHFQHQKCHLGGGQGQERGRLPGSKPKF